MGIVTFLGNVLEMIRNYPSTHGFCYILLHEDCLDWLDISTDFTENGVFLVTANAEYSS